MELTKAELSILLTDDHEIRVINKQYRQVDRSTDVLSFPQVESPPIPPDFDGLLGDVVISVETAARQVADGFSVDRLGVLGAEEGSDRVDRPEASRDWTLADELLFLLIHGVLHLLGYQHEENAGSDAMVQRERELFFQLRE